MRYLEAKAVREQKAIVPPENKAATRIAVFASSAAADRARALGLTAADFEGVAPSSALGFTRADVEQIHAQRGARQT